MRLPKFPVILAIALIAVAGHAADEEGFQSLVKGSTLDGWVLLGQTGEGYLAKDGVISCPPGGGGNLFSAAEYSDFVLRFEFKLEDGSNNGLCIRCPLAWGSLAYVGTELQVIDNTSERYKDIKPWQKHGSLYEVFPARTGYLKPVGEWNNQEVVARGSKVMVFLNGYVILDVDTHSMKDPKTLAKHPGLNRKTGHIGFLGHNEPVAFRNIRIKSL